MKQKKLFHLLVQSVTLFLMGAVISCGDDDGNDLENDGGNQQSPVSMQRKLVSVGYCNYKGTGNDSGSEITEPLKYSDFEYSDGTILSFRNCKKISKLLS